MDTEFGEFFYPGSLVEFHAAADVFARRYNEKGRYMSCEVVAPGSESSNLPSSAYMARFLFAIKDRELSLCVHAFFFVDATQVSEDRTYLKIDSSLPRYIDGSSLVDLDLVWIDLLIHLHVVKDSAPQPVEQSQEIEPPELDRVTQQDSITSLMESDSSQNKKLQAPETAEGIPSGHLPLKPGRPSDKAYDDAYNALYIQRSHTRRREAFDEIVLPTLGELDAVQEKAAYEAFDSAMNRRLQKHRRNTDENTSNQ